MQIQIWSGSRAAPTGTSAVPLTQQSSVCPVSPSSGEMFISMGFFACRHMSEDNDGKGPVRHEEGLGPPSCKSRLLHWYCIVMCKYEITTLNFSSGQCVTPVCILLVPVGRRGNDRGAGHGMHRGDRAQQIHPVTCDLEALSLLVNWSWWDSPAGLGPP